MAESYLKIHFLLLLLIICSHGACAIRPITEATTTSYVVVFDAGSSGSRVHVYKFNSKLELVPMRPDDIEFYSSVKPGLSSYASDPKAAARSLIPLLEDALKAIPMNVQEKTPVRLGATAGLRQLPGDQANRILEEVETLLRGSGLLLRPNSVIVMDGKDEGAFLWICVNYLSGNVGKPFQKTIGAIDLGGGSVQMVYAISDKGAAKAPEGDAYLKTLYMGGHTYHLYVHSYLNYGLLAARAGILNQTNGSPNPCVTTGFKGEYVYGNVKYTAISPTTGASFAKCRKVTFEMLKLRKSCSYDDCTFDGIWSGDGGPGQQEVYAVSFFYDRASELGMFKNTSSTGEYLTPLDFKRTARKICSLSVNELQRQFLNLYEDDYGLLCLDLIYEYTLLVEGFKIPPTRKIKVLSRIPYEGFNVDTSWTLGSAIEAISSPPTKSVM